MTIKKSVVLILVSFGIFCNGILSALTIMPLGDSITAGVDSYTNTSGGYRDPLYRDLVASGVSFTFIGAANGGSTATLSAANESNHNGYGCYRIEELTTNLNANTPGMLNGQLYGDNNQGGFWLTGGNGTGRGAELPDIALLQVGANDFIQNFDPQTTNPSQAQFLSDMDARLYTLVTTFHSISPNTVIFVAAIPPIGIYNNLIQQYNSYIQNTLVPSLSYTRFVDNYTPFLNSDGSINSMFLGTDGIHPNRFGYPVMALSWAKAIRSYLNVNPTTYNLTVNNGTGSGAYPAGSVVTLNSYSPSGGNQFAYWSPGATGMSNALWPLSTYVMPAAATTITANYQASTSILVQNGTYRLGSFWSSLSMGAAGTSNGSQVQQQTYTGAATQQWAVTNLGNNVIELVLAGTSEALEVPGGSSTGGTVLDVSTYTGATYQQWTLTPLADMMELVNVGTGMVAEVANYSTQPGSQLDESTYYGPATQFWSFGPVTGGGGTTYALTVNNGSGSGSYAAGSVVNVSANTPQNGYQFSGWSGNTSALANPSAASTTFTMPASAASITANYTLIATAPSAPTNLTATGGTTQISLSWTASSGATSYNVYRGTTAGGESSMAIATGISSTSYVNTGLGNSTTYYYKVAAVNSVGTSSYSSEATATTSAGGGTNLFNNGTYQLVSQSSTLSLGVNGTTNGSAVNQQTYTGASTQQWNLNNLGSNIVTLIVPGTSEALEVPGSSKSDGTDLDISTYTGGTNQQWTIVSVGGGYYEVVNVNSGYEANVAFNSTTPGALICQWDAGNYSNGVWAITAVSGGTTTYSLTVNSGSGSGYYAAGTVVNVTANGAATGYQFAAWTGSTSALANPAAASTTLTMPASAASITATYTLSATAPSAPTGLTATAGVSQVALSWSASTGATSYNIYRGTSAGGESSTAIATGITATNYTDSSVTNSTTYYYKITAVNSVGASGYSSEVSGTPTSGVSIPAAPTNLAATAGPSQVGLSWTGSTGATSYSIYRGTSAGGESSTAIATGVSATSYNDTSVSNGTTYYYKVTAVNTAGTSSYSNETNATPTAGTGQTIVSVQFPEYYANGIVDPMNANNYTGGVIPVQNWNVADTNTGTSPASNANLVNSNGSPLGSSILISSTGTNTAITFTYSGYTRNDSTNNNAFPSAVWYQSGGLADAYIAGGASFNESGAAETLTLSGLSASHTYNLIVYVTAPWWNNNGANPASISLGGTTYYIKTANTLGNWTQATSTTAGSPTTGNFVQFSNLTGSTTQTVTITGIYVGLAGFQVVDMGGSGGSAPSAPTNLAATAGNTQVALTWTASSGATSYNVYRGTSAGGEGATAIATGITSTSYVNTGLSNGTVYYYKVAAVNTYGTSGYSNEASATPVSGAPAAPTNLSATAGTAQVALSWTASSGATSYNVYRGTSAGGESTTAIATGISSTSYTDTNVTNGTTYYYKVAAVNTSGTSGYSNEVSATPTVGIPAAPTNVSATAGNAQVALSWTGNAQATSYNVYRGTTAGGESTTAIATGISSTSYTDTGVTNGTTYYYKIAAVNTSGTSPYSSEVSAAPTAGSSSYTGLDIGAVGVAGSNTVSNGVYTIKASGADIWSGTDTFRFVYQQLTGDGSIVARVVTVDNTNGYAKAGVMMRNTLDANSAYSFMMTENAQYRSVSGGDTTGGSGGYGAPSWVKVTRAGNVFTTYTSADGVAWYQTSTETSTMNSTIYVGMAVCSHNNAALTTVTMDNVTIGH